MMSIYSKYLKTEFGTISIQANDDAVTEIRFVQDGKLPDANAQTNILTDTCARQLLEYFAGKRRNFNFPYKLSGTDFQIDVWKEIAKIPYGKTISYKELAERINKPQATRAVASAANENCLFLCIPCHRVIGSDGSLVGFAAGLKLKEQLLTLEKEPEAYTKYNYLQFQKKQNLAPKNLITGRYIYSAGDMLFETQEEEILAPHKTHSFSVGIDFTGYSGFTLEANAFMATEYEPVNEPQDITLTFYNASDSFVTKAQLIPGQNIMNFDINDMPFRNVYKITIFSKKPLKNIRICALNVADNYFRYKGQSHFYAPIGCTLYEEKYMLNLNINGRASLESPLLSDSLDSVFYAPLKEKNTIFMVLKNLSTATKIKLFYKTNYSQVYTEDNCVELKLSRSQEFKAYYFNLSATNGFQSKEDDCIITQFKLETEGHGEIILKEYSFECEKNICSNAGTITSCICENYDIHINGTVYEKYVDAESLISVYEVSPVLDGNNSLISYNSEEPSKELLLSVPLSEAAIKNDIDGSVIFSISGISFSKDNVTRLSSKFIAFLEDEKNSIPLGESFSIDNYEDFESNPYDFKLPDYEVCVTDEQFGAKGDGFSDDTNAIQSAIDTVWKQGGGKVIIPGIYNGCDKNTVFYGRRYRITNLLLRNRVELHIANGAVLWQSPIFRDYKYIPNYGRSMNSEEGCFLAANSSNLPTIQCFDCEYVKITGHGKIRSIDTASGSQNLSSNSNGAKDRIHQIPIGFFRVKYALLKDFELVRTNSCHIALHSCSYVYAANIQMHEVNSNDVNGFVLATGTHHVALNRNFIVTNGDGVVFLGCYSNPQGKVWWKSRLGVHGAVRQIKICHSYINADTAKSLSFMPWGTNDDNYEMQEISGITVFDNILIAKNPVGVWSDNPYKGKMNFDNTETDDYSPIKSVRIYGNIYFGESTLGALKATDFLSDTSLYSAAKFQNNDFCISPMPNMSNWSYKLNRNKKSISIRNIKDKYVGVMQFFREGDTALYQGLHLDSGAHKCSFEVQTGETGAFIFVQNIRTGEILIERHILSIDSFDLFEIKFTLSSDSDLFIGIRHPADITSDDEYVALRKATIESVEY